MRKRYYIHYPRNASNEYTIYVAGSERAREWCEAQLEDNYDQSQETWERITRREAEARHRHLYGNYFGELFDDRGEPLPFTDRAERINRSAVLLDIYIEEQEQLERYEAELEARWFGEDEDGDELSAPASIVEAA